MRNKLIRIMSVAVLMVFIMVLYGCSGAKTEETGTSGEEAGTLQPATIKFYWPGTKPEDWDTVKSQIEKQTMAAMNARLNFRWFSYSDYIEKIFVKSASDEAFDAFCCAGPDEKDYLPDIIKMAREGQLKDITELFPDSAPYLYSKYTEQELDYAKVDSKLYAIPSLYPMAYCTYIFANDGLLKKYNINNISTLEEYDSFLETVRSNDYPLTPGAISNATETLKLFSRGFGYVILDSFQRLVYRWDDPKMKIYAWEKTPEFKTITQYMIKWYNNGYIISDSDLAKTASSMYYGPFSIPAEGTTRMSRSTGNDYVVTTEYSDRVRKFILYPYKNTQRDNPLGRFFLNGSFAFSASSPNTERALMFLDWVQRSRSNYYLVTYGIEKRNYILKDGRPTFPDGIADSISSYMFWDGSFSFRNSEYEYHYELDNNEMTYKDSCDVYSEYPPHGAFYPDFKNVEAAARSRAKAFTLFEGALSIGGIKKMSDIDAFISELEGLKTEDIIGEVQKQLDEWKSKN